MPHVTFERLILTKIATVAVLFLLGLPWALVSAAFRKWADALRDRNRGDDR